MPPTTNLTRRSFAALTFASLLPRAATAAARKPNFIFILVDDLGWTDVACFGSKFYQTPNVDKLAARGMKFTQGYSACTVCSPSRAAILTGKYPARLHITDWIAGHPYPHAKLKPPDWTKYLPLEEVTVAERLKSAGYATASIGKWHLGGHGFEPEKQGFDLNVAGTDRGSPPSYFSPYKIATLPDGPAGEYLTDRESAEAVKFIEKNKDRPFFLYLPHHAVHNPVQAKQDVTERYKTRVQPGAVHSKPAYAALIESVDDSVGRVMAKLEELGLENDTMVVFTGDNGGLIQNTSNVPLRAGKGSAYEGGVRVPTIVTWPATVKSGSVCDVPVMGIDFASTMLNAANIKPASRMDGESLLPLLQGGRRLNRSTLYWHYPHYHPGGATPYSAVRDGNWKLIEFHEDSRVELYDLAADIGEQRDLAAAMPAKAKQLRAKLGSWLHDVRAQMPLPNADFAPAPLK
jgi:arylsulfatase A